MIRPRISQLLSQRFLSLLACPACIGDLTLQGEQLRCFRCGRSYDIVDGIPILLLGTEESHAQIEAQRKIFDPQFDGFVKYSLDNWRVSYLTRIFTELDIRGNSEGLYLDIGVGGSGYTVIEAARRGFIGVGCDLSFLGVRKAVEFAQDQGLSNRTFFVVCSAEALPFRTAQFDALSCIAVLEHLVRDDLATRHMARVARAGARFFVTVPNAFRRANPLFWPTFYIEDRRHGHLRHYSDRTLSRLFSRYFNQLKLMHTVRFFKGIQFLLSSLHILPEKYWWYLERLDLRNQQSPWGAMLHLSGTRTAAPFSDSPGSQHGSL